MVVVVVVVVAVVVVVVAASIDDEDRKSLDHVNKPRPGIGTRTVGMMMFHCFVHVCGFSTGLSRYSCRSRVIQVVSGYIGSYATIRNSCQIQCATGNIRI